MELELTICKASEAAELVRSHQRDNTPFAIVISIEHPCDESVSLEQGRAPRLAKEVGAEWTDRQIILTCHDIETSFPDTPVPPLAVVQSALDHFEKWRPAENVMRVLIHCRSGKARSTAVGLVLLRRHRGPGTEKECLEELLRVRPLAAPNIAIVEHGDTLLGCGGALITVVESDPEVTSRRAEANFGYLARAGQQASERGALKESELYFKRAIDALTTMPETPERAQRELSLLSALWVSLLSTSGSAADETWSVATRIQQLAEKTGNREQLFFALLGAWFPTVARGEVNSAQQIADQMLEIAERSAIDSKLTSNLTMAHLFQGNTRMFRGDLIGSMQHFGRSNSFYDETDFANTAIDPQMLALGGMGRVLWNQGLTDQARASIAKSIALSERSRQPANIAQAFLNSCGFFMELRELGNVQEAAERLFNFSREQQLKPFLNAASVCRGWAMAERGRAAEATVMIREQLDSIAARGERLFGPLLALSEAQARAGQIDDALSTVDRAFSAVGEHQINLPRLLWRRGELHSQHGDETEAARDFQDAINVARRIGSKAYELRATASFARLLAKQGKREAAGAMLAEIYSSFTEGFDTLDLRDARAFLDEAND
jgi:predicted protein tyrosine phosphatase